MENNLKRHNGVKWAGLALVLAGVATQHNNRLGEAYLFLALGGFILLALFHVLNLKTYLNAPEGNGTRKKGAVIYLSAMAILFVVFAVFCLLRLDADGMGEL